MLESTIVQAFSQLIINFAALVALSLILYRQNLQMSQRIEDQRERHVSERQAAEEEHKRERMESDARMIEALTAMQTSMQSTLDANTRAIESNSAVIQKLLSQAVTTPRGGRM